MLFQAMVSNSNGSQPVKPPIKYVEPASSSMMPTRMTAVLNEPLAGFLVMCLPRIPNSGRLKLPLPW